MSTLKGRVALVTGASSGIGRAIVRSLADAGMSIAFCARRVDRLASLASELDTKTFYAGVDVRDTEALVGFIQQASANLDGLDVLVNNAGLGRLAPLVDGETEAWREMLEVNVLALCVATREAITEMRRRQVAGHVVHVSSMAAHRVPPQSGVYSATKYAVRSLTEGLRKELRSLKSPIRVTSVSPGFVETEFAARYHGRPEAAEETYGRYPVLADQDVANAVRYALEQPEHVQVHDILMRPTAQPT